MSCSSPIHPNLAGPKPRIPPKPNRLVLEQMAWQEVLAEGHNHAHSCPPSFGEAFGTDVGSHLAGQLPAKAQGGEAPVQRMKQTESRLRSSFWQGPP